MNLRADLLFLLGMLLPPVLLALTFRFVWPAPRKTIVMQVLVVTLVPLALLSAYMVFEYRTWRWSVFPYGSLAPHALAAAIFLVSFSFLLWKATAPSSAKLAVASVTIVSWVILWFITAFFTACAMGDCL